MTNRRLMTVLALLAGFTLPALAASGRQEITAAQIAAAITAAGLNVSAGQVTLLSDVVATTNAPALKVDSVKPWDSSRMRVRLECVYGQQCLPFVVAIRRNQAIASPAIASQPIASQAGLTAAGSASYQRIQLHAQARASSKAVALQAGTAAVLLLDGGHVHIRISVICLESGTAGQTIRVKGRGNQQVYFAEVGDDGILRGRL